MQIHYLNIFQSLRMGVEYAWGKIASIFLSECAGRFYRAKTISDGKMQ